MEKNMENEIETGIMGFLGGILALRTFDIVPLVTTEVPTDVPSPTPGRSA